jgi:hypothetical protein
MSSLALEEGYTYCFVDNNLLSINLTANTVLLSKFGLQKKNEGGGWCEPSQFDVTAV